MNDYFGLNPEDDAMSQERVKRVLQLGMDLEDDVDKQGGLIRNMSQDAYDVKWLDARLMLMSVLGLLQKYKAGVPGKSGFAIAERITLVAAFSQGSTFTERLISEGQYIKAAACLKQDFEIVVRLKDVVRGNAKPGRNPKIADLDQEAKRWYGELNDISHPAKFAILQSLMHARSEGRVKGIGVYPEFVNDMATRLYATHLWTLSNVAMHQIMLSREMYGEDDPEIDEATHLWCKASNILLEADIIQF